MRSGLHAIGLPRAGQLDAALRLWGTPGGSRDELVDDQSEKLRALINFAARRVPYFRRLFDRLAVDPSTIRTAADLERLPVATKLELREEPRADLMPPGADPDRLIADRSSGSTGIKLLLWREPFELHLMQLYRMRAWLQVGIRPYHRLARVSSAFGPWSRTSMRLPRLRQAMRIFHTTQVQARQSPEDVLAALVACRPDVVMGYSGVVHEVARLARQLGEERLRPRLVVCGGETLVPQMRQAIEESLGTRVLDSYGAMEFNLVAWECPATGLYHVDEDALVVELLGADGRPVAEGEQGEVVVTGLHSYALPLIRYHLGDLAVRGPAPCPCGAPFATLARIRGRTVEYYYRSDGSAIYHWQLSSALNQTIPDSVNRYQIVQESDGRIVYRVMPLGELADEQLAALERVGAELLGEGTPFEVRIETEIPCAPSGKMLQSVNRMRNTTGRSPFDPSVGDLNRN